MPKYLSIHTVSAQSNFIIMSVIKAEPVDPYLVGAIATGRPKLEVLVDETVVKADPGSAYYNGLFVKDVASIKEECSLNTDTVCFRCSFYARVTRFYWLYTHRKFRQRAAVNVVEQMMQRLRVPVVKFHLLM